MGNVVTPEDFMVALLKGFDQTVLDGSASALHIALELFTQALLMNESRPEPHLGMAMCYTNLGDDIRAIRHYDATLELGFGTEDYPEVVYEFDDDEGQVWEVEICLDHVLVWRAGCFISLDRFEPARRDLGRISDSCNLDIQIEVALSRAKICLTEDDLLAAQRHLSYALGLDPEHPEAHFVRGLIHERSNAMHLALKAYSRAIKRDCEAADFCIARARCHLANGNIQQAEADLQSAETLLAEQLPQPQRTAWIKELRSKLQTDGAGIC